jgi:cytochrome c-type biogenesis protein CcmF
VLLLSGLALVGLGVAFWTDAFPLRYVSDHSNREMEPLYKLTGVWAGDRGLLLLRTAVLAFVASLVVRRDGVGRGWAMATLLALLSGGLLLHLFVLSPFDRLAFNPADGRGPMPALRDGWMALHTGAVHLGATLFAVPFALGVGALVAGRSGSSSVASPAGYGGGSSEVEPVREAGERSTHSPGLEDIRRWVLAGWLLVGAGILAGMRRAYGDPASGGFWGWDPAEVAVLVLWLVATALLHTLRIEARTGSLARWNLALVLLLFPLGLVAPVLAGSGLLESAHPLRFGAGALRGVVGFGVVIGVGAVLLFTARGGGGREPGAGVEWRSREAALLAGGLLLLGMGAIAGWGSLAPLLTGGIGEAVTVGPAFFELVLLPLGLVVLAGMGIAPLLRWGRMSGRALARALLLPVAVAGVTGLGLVGLGMQDGWALGVVALFAFLLAAQAVLGWRVVRGRMGRTGEGALHATLGEFGSGVRRCGGRLAHLGLALLVVGAALSSRGTMVRATLDPGDAMEITTPTGGVYTLNYLGMSTASRGGIWQVIASFRVVRDGVEVAFIDTERRMHAIPPRTTSSWGLHRTAVGDVRILMEGTDEAMGLGNDPDLQRADFHVEYRPFMAGVGYGGILLLLGGLLAFRREDAADVVERGEA